MTEMDGAYKPGVRLRVLRLCGHYGNDEPLQGIALNLRIFAEELPATTSFDDAERMIRARFVELCRGVAVPDHAVPVRDRDIKGVYAPRVPLVFNCPRWGIKVDEGGISMHDDDRHNEGREITHDQSGARAYDIARKVWEQVIQAPTMSTAAHILTEAGARLHYYCGMD
jgi:hypothetical protein